MKSTKDNTTPGYRVSLLILAILLAGAPAAWAQRPIDERGPASPSGRVSIANLAGSIEVRGWDREEIQITGTLDDEAEGLDFKFGKKSYIEVEYPRRTRNTGEGSHLVVMIPGGSTLDIEGVATRIEVSGVTGPVEIMTTKGDVEVAGPCRSLEIGVVQGNVTATGVEGPLEIECSQGLIRAAGGRAAVEIEGVQCAIDVDFELLDELAVESISGDITVAGGLAAGGSFEIAAYSGSITLILPADVSAEFEATTFSGTVSGDFDLGENRSGKWMPGKEYEFTLGDGQADVELTAFSGDIEIRKR